MSLIQKVKRNMEGRNWLRRTEFILFIALLIATIVDAAILLLYPIKFCATASREV